MKSAYTYALVILFTCPQATISAQQIKIGQLIPKVTLYNVLNHSSDSLPLANLKGKAIILDYWGFNCVSCLQAFPKVDSLQKQFKDRLQILLVNRDSKQETLSFFGKRKKILMPAVPLITGDSILNQFFPHTGVPFHVWIDSTGKVSYLTAGKYMTADNIQKYLAGTDLQLPYAELSTYPTSLFKPEAEPSLKYFSYIANCMDRGSYHITGLENASATINTYYCVSIKDLYQFAFNESLNDGNYKFREPGRTILEVKDKFKYEYPHDPLLTDSWIQEHAYYYNLSLPEQTKKNKYKIMQQDLGRHFNLEAKIIKRKVRCLALIRTSSTDKLKTKGGPCRYGWFSHDLRNEDSESSTLIQNMPFKNLFDGIRNKGRSLYKTKIINHTGYEGNIDFEIPEEIIESGNAESFRNLLRKYDLDLIEKYVLMDVLLLKERSN